MIVACCTPVPMGRVSRTAPSVPRWRTDVEEMDVSVRTLTLKNLSVDALWGWVDRHVPLRNVSRETQNMGKSLLIYGVDVEALHR